MLKGCILSEKEKKLFYVLKVSHLLWHPYEGLQIFICVVRVREVFELLFNLSIFCNISLGCVYTKRICKKLCFDLCVYVCVYDCSFLGVKGWFFIHLELILRVCYCGKEKEGVEKGTDWFSLSFFLPHKEERTTGHKIPHTEWETDSLLIF